MIAPPPVTGRRVGQARARVTRTGDGEAQAQLNASGRPGPGGGAERMRMRLQSTDSTEMRQLNGGPPGPGPGGAGEAVPIEPRLGRLTVTNDNEVPEELADANQHVPPKGEPVKGDDLPDDVDPAQFGQVGDMGLPNISEASTIRSLPSTLRMGRSFATSETSALRSTLRADQSSISSARSSLRGFRSEIPTDNYPLSRSEHLFRELRARELRRISDRTGRNTFEPDEIATAESNAMDVADAMGENLGTAPTGEGFEEGIDSGVSGELGGELGGDGGAGAAAGIGEEAGAGEGLGALEDVAVAF